MRFELSFAGGAALHAHRKRCGDFDRAFAWDRIEAPVAPGARRWAARAWLRSAFNEYHSAVLMSEMLTIMIEAQVPLDLCTTVGDFPTHELAHAELCARLSLALGTADAVAAAPPRLPAVDRRVTGLERCHQIVVRNCVVGEGLSFGWLSAMARRGTQPVVKRVLRRLIKDEALHHAFGWRYLDWALPSLSRPARTRLMHAVAADLNRYLRRAVGPHPVPSPGVLDLYRHAGLLAGEEVAAVAARTADEIRTGLSARGLRAPASI